MLRNIIRKTPSRIRHKSTMHKSIRFVAGFNLDNIVRIHKRTNSIGNYMSVYLSNYLHNDFTVYEKFQPIIYRELDIFLTNQSVKESDYQVETNINKQ